MYVIREILHCRPGKVRDLLEKFRILSATLSDTGRPPLRLLTDVAGDNFWTLVVEATVEKVDDFFELERTMMASETVRQAMAGYHDVVMDGRREIFRLES